MNKMQVKFSASIHLSKETIEKMLKLVKSKKLVLELNEIEQLEDAIKFLEKYEYIPASR